MKMIRAIFTNGVEKRTKTYKNNGKALQKAIADYIKLNPEQNTVTIYDESGIYNTYSKSDIEY